MQKSFAELGPSSTILTLSLSRFFTFVKSTFPVILPSVILSVFIIGAVEVSVISSVVTLSETLRVKEEPSEKLTVICLPSPATSIGFFLSSGPVGV